MDKKTIAILGSGSWGTAVAIHLAKIGNRVLLWGRTLEHVEDMRAKGCNQLYLPTAIFPETLEPVSDLAYCQQEADILLIAVPSQAFTDVLAKLDKPKNGLAWLTKGVDPVSNQLLSHIVQQRFGKALPIAAISGPSFAKEVAKGLPTAITLAGNNLLYQKMLQGLLHHSNMRVYLSNDLIGVQLCGAVKNVLAIACGISDGLGYGSNAKAALITRGLAEMRRLGLALGAREETFMGLAGVGDLVLTCTDNQSRNRRFGLLVGQGVSIADAEKNIGQVVEGKHNAAQVCLLAHEHAVEMPICTQIDALLQATITPQEAVVNLMSRKVRDE